MVTRGNLHINILEYDLWNEGRVRIGHGEVMVVANKRLIRVKLQ